MNGRILLIDDNPHDRHRYGDRLQDSGYNVGVAAGWGKALYTIIDNIQPDLIITELVAPQRDESMTLLEMLIYNHTGVPIVIHTAHKSKSSTYGPHAFVRKSSHCKALINEVGKTISKSAPNSARSISTYESSSEPKVLIDQGMSESIMKHNSSA